MSRAGFSLLELLLVMLIVGLIASLAMPGLPRKDETALLRDSMQTLYAALRLQGEEALLTGTLRGVRIGAVGDGPTAYRYEWLIWSSDDARWLPGENIVQFNGALRGAGDLLLEVDGRAVVLPHEGVDQRSEQLRDLPQVVLYPSGESSHFSLTVWPPSGLDSFALEGDLAGVGWVDEGAEE